MAADGIAGVVLVTAVVSGNGPALAELAEAAWVSTAIRAGGGFAHGRLAFKFADQAVQVSDGVSSSAGQAIPALAQLPGGDVLVEGELGFIGTSSKILDKIPEGAVVGDAAGEVGPALFFSLLIITLSFVPVFTLEAQEGRMFAPLAFTHSCIATSSACSRRSCSTVGESTSRSRQACRPMAASRQLRANRPLPNIGPRGVVSRIASNRRRQSSVMS